MTFKKFEKIARLGTMETDGILKGTCYISAKLDGANGSVWMSKGIMQFGSRNRGLSIGADNAGFMSAMKDHIGLKDLMEKHPTWRIYGEWLVPHTIKGYFDGAWRKFYVYDVEDNGTSISPEIWQKEMDAIDFIPHICVENPTMDQVEIYLKAIPKWLMKQGEMGEGIVIKNFGFTNRYGDMRYAKYINDGFQNRPKKVATDNQVEAGLAELCVTEGLIKKNADKIIWASADFMAQIGEKPQWDRKTMIPMLMRSVLHDVMTEKLEAALEEMKNPTVNFKVFKGAVSRAVKLYGKEFF